MLETRKNDQRARNERIHVGRNKTRRERHVTKRATRTKSTPQAAHYQPTLQPCNDVRARKRRTPTIRGAPTRSDQQRTHISGARASPQSQLPNAPHSHADPGRQHREPPNPARPHPRKTHEQHPGLGKPLYLSSFNQPRATDTARGHEKRAHTPHKGCARDADETNNSTPATAHATTRTPTAR